MRVTRRVDAEVEDGKVAETEGATDGRRKLAQAPIGPRLDTRGHACLDARELRGKIKHSARIATAVHELHGRQHGQRAFAREERHAHVTSRHKLLDEHARREALEERGHARGKRPRVVDDALRSDALRAALEVRLHDDGEFEHGRVEPVAAPHHAPARRGHAERGRQVLRDRLVERDGAGVRVGRRVREAKLVEERREKRLAVRAAATLGHVEDEVRRERL